MIGKFVKGYNLKNQGFYLNQLVKYDYLSMYLIYIVNTYKFIVIKPSFLMNVHNNCIRLFTYKSTFKNKIKWKIINIKCFQDF